MLAVPERRAVSAALSERLRVELCGTPGVRLRRLLGGQTAIRASADVADLVGAALRIPLLGEVPSTGKGADLSRLSSRLFTWQSEGATALATGAKRLLWWSPGIGKSLAYLSAADLVAPPPLGRVLIVTRAMGREVFARDSVLLRDPRRVAIVIGEGAVDGAGLTASQESAVRRAEKALGRQRDRGADVIAVGSVTDALAQAAWAVVVGWETLVAHEAAVLAAKFDVAIFDEHHCGKGHNSARTRAAHRISRAVPIVWGGTATPVPDRVRDLWGQLWCVGGHAAWGGSLGFAKAYAHATPGQFGGWDTAGPHRRYCAFCDRARAELKWRLGWWADVRTRAVLRDVLPLASRDLIRVPVEVQSGASAADIGSRSRGIEGAIALATDRKLRPAAVRAAEALIAGEKIAVVGNRRAWVPRMAKAIAATLPVSLSRDGRVWLRETDGSDDVTSRLRLADEFMSLRVGPGEQYRAACLVATGDSIRCSIDLHDADLVLNAALPWTPEGVEQLEGRFRRAGQRRPVRYEYLIAEGTIDEAIERTLLGKMEALALAGAEVESETRIWFGDARPSEAEVLAGLREWLQSRAALIERAVSEGAA